MTLDEAIQHCIDEADILAGSECGLDHAQLASWLQDYKRLKEQQPAVSMPKPDYLMYVCQLSLCLKDISVPKSFLTTALKQMAEKLKTMDKDTPEFKELSYYTQILHGGVQMMEAALDIVAGLSLLMSKDMSL